MKITAVNNSIMNKRALKPTAFKGHYDIENNNILKNRSELYHCTAFFRDFLYNKMIVKYVNEHFKNNDKIKILSAGCSTGEEVITMSMLFDNLKDKVEILGVDLSEEAVKSAQSGKFKMDYMVNGGELEDNYLFVDTGRNLSSTQKKLRDLFNKYLEPTNEKSINSFTAGYKPYSYFSTMVFKLKDGMAKNCRFVQGDIRDIPTLTNGEKFDVVLCRNTLYHLFPSIHAYANRKLLEEKRLPIQKIYNSVLPQLTQSVKEGGILCFGQDEFSQLHFFNYLVKFIENCGFGRFKKPAEYGEGLSNMFLKIKFPRF